MSRQPWRDCPIGSRAFEAHEDRLREQADRLEKDQHLGTMDGPPPPVTPESVARMARLDAALKEIELRLVGQKDRTLNSYDQARLENIEAIAAGKEIDWAEFEPPPGLIWP